MTRILAIEFHFPEGTKRREGTCMGCGCHDERACEGGCFWIDPSHLLCSACLGGALDAIDPRRKSDVSDVSAEDEFVSLTIPLKKPSKPKAAAKRGRRK